MTRILTNGITYCVAAAALGWLVCGTFPSRAADSETGGLDVVKVRPNFYMIAGAGGNIGVQIGSDGIVLVNAGTAAAADQVLAALKKLTDLPIRYVINTGAEAEFVGGNEKLSKAGLAVLNNAGQAAILAPEPVLRRMSVRNAKEPYPVAAWPTEAFVRNRQTLRMNDEGIEVLYQPAAHSDADSFVVFRRSDVVVTGDIMDTTRFPIIDVANGGSIDGEIAALNKLIDLTIAPTPFIYKDVGTYVIPGHGRVCEQMEVVDYRDMVVQIRDTIADGTKKGRTLDQIKAAHPALAYETRFGTQPGATNSFIESIYKSLTAKK